MFHSFDFYYMFYMIPLSLPNLLLNMITFNFHIFYWFLNDFYLNILFMFCGYKIILSYSEDFFFLFLSLNFHFFLQDQVCLFILVFLFHIADFLQTVGDPLLLFYS